MNIHITTDAHIDGREGLRHHIEGVVAGGLGRFGDRVTRVEVFLSDEGSGTKPGGGDKRCVMEARLAGLRPIAVTHRKGTIHQAIEGAMDKLEKTLDRTLGRLKDVRAHVVDANTEES